jgi:ETC complex I subunit conserved region
MSDGITSVRDSPTGYLAAEPAVTSASTFPTDAVAVIYRPARSAMTSGTANSEKWKLRFERCSAPFIEPLMGWTGGDDPLGQVEMTFPSAEAAIAYTRRQGLEFVLRRSKEVEMTGCHRVSTLKPDDRVCRPAAFPPRALVKGPSRATVENCPAEDDQAQPGAALDYASPNEVLRDPKRSIEQKREILRRWALAACRLDGTNMQRAAHEESSQLDKIIDALLDLDETAASPFAVKGRSTTRINSGERAA